jgi:hypothetical protein
MPDEEALSTSSAAKPDASNPEEERNPATDDALFFAALVEQRVVRGVSKGERLEPQAFIMARRPPGTQVHYPDGDFVLLMQRMGPLVSEAAILHELALVRTRAERCGAIGVATAWRVYCLKMPCCVSPTVPVGAAPCPREALFVSVEHRGLPRPRRRLALVPEPGAALRPITWVNLDSCGSTAFAHSEEVLPSLLPPLD